MSTLRTTAIKHATSTSNNIVLDSGGNTTITGSLTVSGNSNIGNTTVTGLLTITGGINANGTIGSNGQVLTSNGSVAYWANGSSQALSLYTVFMQGVI